MATMWGIVSAGKICHDFVTAVRSIPSDEHKFVAVAARNVNTAKEFAARHKIPKAYGSYEELAKDPDVEVVYIGTINSQHFPVGKLMLEHGKHVLMEKPMTLNSKQTKSLIQLAKKNKCFLMEAIWSRFLPSYQHLMKLLRDNAIGDVVHVNANFGIMIAHIDRIAKKAQGGGTLLDLGIYALNAVTMVYNGEKPEKIAAVGHLNEDGVDIAMSASLLYKNKRIAQVATSGIAEYPNDMVITGSKGRIKIPSEMWCATTIQTENETFNFPLPDTILPCNFTNSSGLRYEAIEVRKCLKAGLLESSVMPLRDSETLAEIMDEIRHQIGFVFDED